MPVVKGSKEGKRFIRNVKDITEHIQYMKETGHCYIHKDIQLEPLAGISFGNSDSITQFYGCPIKGCKIQTILPATEETCKEFYEDMNKTFTI